MEQVKVFDATLYGGGQSPGASLNIEEKLEIARLLEQMRVDVIQAGFPISSPDEFKAVQSLAEEIRGCGICALARARQEDVDVAAAALKAAAHPRIQVGLGVSDSYVVGKLKTTREAALEMGVAAVRYARRYVDDVQYYAADACRADVEYLYRVLEAVIEAGATTVNIPDAIGFFVPSEWGALIRGIRENVPNIDKAVISVQASERTCPTLTKQSSPCTATMIWAWPAPIRWRRWPTARARPSARSTGSASEPATPACKR